MKKALYLLWFSLVLLEASLDWTATAWAQSRASPGSPGQQTAPAAAARLEDLERRIGPLKIKEQSFTIVLHLKRIRGVGEETLVRMEVRDEGGKVSYEASFPFEVEGDNFVETTGVSARLLEGTQGSGILLVYDNEPSTPLGGGSYQVLGLFNGQLVPFSKPISLEGSLVEPEPPPEKVVKTTTEPGRQGDVLQFRVWTSNFFVVIPVLVDWMQAKMRPAWQCFRMTARGMQSQCRFKVETDRRPPESDLTFVRLHVEPEEGMGIAEHVVIKKTSKVEILEAEGPQLWEEEAEGIGLSVGDDLWLKVRIDGKEGWIHTQEDFTAIGLPQAG
jgi:hypothetical protein